VALKPTPTQIPGPINAAVEGERTVAKVLARVLPGGQNDMAAQNQAIDRQNKDRQFIMNSNLSMEKKAQLLHNMNANHTIADDIKQTQKSIPSRGQAAAGVASTAIDALSGGTLKGLKLGTKARVALRTTGNAAAGGFNAAAGGGDKKQIIENTVAGAALPEVLSGGKLLRQGAKVTQKQSKAFVETAGKPGKAKLGMNANENLDSILGAGSVDYNKRNPVTRAFTNVQEGLIRKPVDFARDKANDYFTKQITSE
jgi:hypothetical protein